MLYTQYQLWEIIMYGGKDLSMGKYLDTTCWDIKLSWCTDHRKNKVTIHISLEREICVQVSQPRFDACLQSGEREYDPHIVMQQLNIVKLTVSAYTHPSLT